MKGKRSKNVGGKHGTSKQSRGEKNGVENRLDGGFVAVMSKVSSSAVSRSEQGQVDVAGSSTGNKGSFLHGDAVM